jgi:hypothetical protein
MNAAIVPYRSRRPLTGCPCAAAPILGLSGLGASSRKRNGDAFGAAFPGIQWKSDSHIILPAKFGGVTVNREGFDELAGTWYGATYHPDGDQAGWQQKFDEALKKYGAYNAYYGTSAAPTSTPTPTPVAPINVAPRPTTPILVQPAPSILPSSPPGVPAGVVLSTNPAFKMANGYEVYYGSDGKYYQSIPGGFRLYTGKLPGDATAVNPPAQVVPLPAVVNPQQPPPTTGGADTQALIQQLIAQGASSQQAFAAAMQSLAAAGVQPTPQLQQAVANDVANTPQQASVMWLAGGAAALIVFGIVLSRRKNRR